ncbi:MAG: hypothetical protein ACPLTP_07955 [Thermotoga caldifontis]|uniref:hypothetical protein n=1 Tax=Thermotoga caldifontis TaxID=1508419 RepID=UPI003C7A7829
MKKLMLFFLVLSVAVFASDYAFYYDCSPDRETAIMVTNLSDENASLRLLLFDSYGKRLFQQIQTLAPYQTWFLDLTSVVTPSTTSWGLAMLQSDQLLYVLALYTGSEKLTSIDHVIEPITINSDAKYYWYAVNYVNFDTWKTWVAIMNPNKVQADVEVYVYDGKQGGQVDVLSGTLEPYAVDYVDLTEIAEAGNFGVIDVRSNVPLVLAVEYWREDELAEVDNVVDWYATTGW